MDWSGKRYHTWNWHLRHTFGEKVAKISLDAGFSCPNREDGSGGCIFCSPRGSGDCAGDRTGSLAQQFQQVRGLMQRKWPKLAKYIAYFQAYTNTMAPVSQLEALYREALAQEGVVGLSISTRPDCLPPPVLDLLEKLNQETWLWVELGLQSAFDRTLASINRGHSYAEFVQAVRELQRRRIKVCAHVILGLPGENEDMMVETAKSVATLSIQGIKIHALHVVKGTRLAEMWSQGQVPLFDLRTYAHWVAKVLEVLPPEMVVQRVTGDAPAHILLAPNWIRRKWEVLQAIDTALEEADTWQGKEFQSLCSAPGEYR